MSIIQTISADCDSKQAKHQAFIDPSLTMRELGLLARLLSHSIAYPGNVETLAADFRCGRDQIRNTMRGLSEAGYMRLLRWSMPDGRISSRWFVCATCGYLYSREFMRHHPTAIVSKGGAKQ